MRILVSVTAVLLLMGSTAYAADGAAVYKERCAKCHGDTGKSDSGMGKAMKVPVLAGNAKLAAMSAADIAAAIKGPAKHAAVVKAMKDDDVNAVAGHVKLLAAGE